MKGSIFTYLIAICSILSARTNVAEDQINHEVLTKTWNATWITRPDASDLPVNLTIEGKLVWFCEPREIGAEYGGLPLRVFEREH